MALRLPLSQYRLGVVVNPHSSSGRTARRWPPIEARLRRLHPEVSIRFTNRPGHAIALTRELLRDGFQLIVAVGGDGTIHEVANGFFAGGRPLNPEAALALLPLGTGGDYRRSLGIRHGPAHALQILETGCIVTADVGRIRYTDPHGAPAERLFVNTTSFGMGGDVARRAHNFFSPLGGNVSFFWATIRSFLSYRYPTVSVWLDDEAEPAATVPITDVAVGIGAYHGGGMKVCPTARLDDGLLEVTLIERLTFRDYPDLPILYSDRIYTHRRVRHFQARRVRASSPMEVRIQVDGEPLGCLPVEIDVIPRALAVLIPQRTPFFSPA